MKTFAIQNLIYTNIKFLCGEFERVYSKHYLRLPIYGQWADLNHILNWCSLGKQFINEHVKILSEHISDFEYFKNQLEFTRIPDQSIVS